MSYQIGVSYTNAAVWSADAPEGHSWKCDQCGHLASLGGNMGFHLGKEGHESASIVPTPAPVTEPAGETLCDCSLPAYTLQRDFCMKCKRKTGIVAPFKEPSEGEPFELSPAMVQARNDQLNAENDALRAQLEDDQRFVQGLDGKFVMHLLKARRKLAAAQSKLAQAEAKLAQIQLTK